MIVDIYNTNKKYSIIYADPPWSYNDKIKCGNRGAACKYDVMSLKDIKALPINDISADNSILFMWITMPFLPWLSEVMNAWGFKYKTCGFTWIKKTRRGGNSLGLGHYTRGNAELCLIGVKGKGVELQSKSISQIVEAERLKHSEKPAIIRNKIIELCGDISRIELFARQTADGWDAWGNEL